MLKTVIQSHSDLGQPNPFASLFSPVGREMAEVEDLLNRELASRYDFVNKLLKQSNRLSGKRLRPALLLLSGKAIGELTPAHLKLAAAIEMVHTATLVHDDILDSATQRRHSPTLNSEFGNQAAILTGDFLFSHAFYLTSTLPSTFAAKEIGQATNKVCEGEIRQIGTKGNFKLTEAEYIEIINAKTAVLCGCATKLGAYYAGATSAQTDAAESFGVNLGIAFQIVDDLLDIVGSESKTGKSLGTDLKQQKPTLPIIHHLSQLPPTEREKFQRQLLGMELCEKTIQARLDETGSLHYSRTKAEEYAELAVNQTSQLNACEATRVLIELPNLLLGRQK